MTFDSVVKHIRTLLTELTVDLEKAAHGNKAASQRVRTGTIKLEKMAKQYRQISIKAEKSGTFKKVKKAPAKKAAAKKAPAKKCSKTACKPAKKKAHAKKR